MTTYMSRRRSIGTDYDNAGNRTGIGMVDIICETGGVEFREKKNVWKGRNGKLEEGGGGGSDWSGDNLFFEEAVFGGSAGEWSGAGSSSGGVSREI
jgi:hypothetical protein